MDIRATCSRRYLIALAAGIGLLPAPSEVHARFQNGNWQPSDGLRLAGSWLGLTTLDPALARDADTIFLARQVSRGLVGYDEKLAPVAELARAIEASEDATAYTFELHSDAMFHDGRTIVAEDVRFSLSRALNPAIANGDASQLPGATYLGDIVGADRVMAGEADALEGVEIIDDRTVRISLVAPSTTFLMKLAAVPASIVDRHQDTSSPDWWTALNGSGPYRIAEYDAESGLRLKAVEDWLGNTIPVKDIDILLGNAAAQPVNLAQAGKIDLVPELPASLVSLVSDPATGMEDTFVLEKPDFSLSYIAFGNQQPPLDDPHIRRALQYCFPADRFAAAAFDERVLVAEGVIPLGMLGQDWPAEMPAVDVQAARQEIAASRYGNAASVPPIRIHAADIAPVEALRDVAQDELGITVEAIQVNWFDFLEGLTSRMFDAYALFWSLDYPDPEALLWVLFGSDSGQNYTGYTNAALDDVLAGARREMNDDRRKELYARAQQILIDDAAIIPLYIPVRYTLARSGMSHLPVTSMGLLRLEALS